MTIIVTGAAGFIGSNLVRALNQRGLTKIIAVDNFTRPEKYRNLIDCDIEDYFDKTDFLARFAAGQFGHVRAVFHQGACSDTMQMDGRYMMENNFRYSQAMLETCLVQRTPFLYASSAAIYGASSVFSEARQYEKPLNIYGYSKFLFDQVVRRVLPQANSQIVGFRYFNVYGPGEAHKGQMASVAAHHFQQFRDAGTVRLFGEYGGCQAGEHQRDFVSVEDVVKVNLFFFDHSDKSGIFNLGTGRAQAFNDIARTVVNTLRAKNQLPLSLTEMTQEGLVEYIEFPDVLRGKYQCFTQADISSLREAGYTEDFLTVEQGVARYCNWLASK
ncbi:MAG: ADP-glyceromanno-heptose 6-epimerase [Ottowia sp.]|nr:ADP-glyceromanno-heptose 6-epimerase [Ottowia sp.]